MIHSNVIEMGKMRKGSRVMIEKNYVDDSCTVKDREILY